MTVSTTINTITARLLLLALVVSFAAAKEVEWDGFFFDGSAGCSSKGYGTTITVNNFKVECEGDTQWGGGYQESRDEEDEEDEQEEQEEVEEYESPFDLCGFGKEMKISGTGRFNCSLFNAIVLIVCTIALTLSTTLSCSVTTTGQVPEFVTISPRICHRTGSTCFNLFDTNYGKPKANLCDMLERNEDNNQDDANAEEEEEECQEVCGETCENVCGWNCGEDQEDCLEACSEDCQEGCNEQCAAEVEAKYQCPAPGSYDFETTLELSEDLLTDSDMFTDFYSSKFLLRVSLTPIWSSYSSSNPVYCHVPFHMVDSETFDMDAYMASSRYYRGSMYTASALGVVALLGLSLAWNKKRRRPTINLDDGALA